jgi:hypothetical protein
VPNAETLECDKDKGVEEVPTAVFDAKVVPIDELRDALSRNAKTDFLTRETSEGNRKPWEYL